MTLIKIDPIGTRNAGLAAIQAADALQDHAGQLRALELPAMPPAMAAKYEAGFDEVAAKLVGASGTFGPAGIELQVRAAAAESTDAQGGVGSANAGSVLDKSLRTSVVIPGGKTAIATITATATGDVRTAVVAPVGLKFTLADAIKVPVGETPAAGSDGKNADGTTNPKGNASDNAAGERTTGQSTKQGDEVSGRAAGAVAQAVYGDAGSSAGGGGGGAAAGGGAGSSVIAGDLTDPSSAADGQHRAENAGEPPKVPADDASRQDWACWMAKSAAREGIPPSLPIMSALINSDFRPSDRPTDSGFFGFDPATTKAPSGHGSPAAIQAADWWRSNPEAQLDLFIKRALRSTADGDASMTDPHALGRWAAATTPDGDPAVLSGAAINAQEMVDECGDLTGAAGAAGAAGGGAVASGAGDGALAVAKSQLGVHEVGNNGGAQVDTFLASAGVGTGNPWCASFVHWSMAEAGNDLPGGGWAAVANWVNAAQNGDYGLTLVDAAHAMPGDIVAYDWGGDNNFASDGHIGFLESKVEGGQFTAVEGNAQDAVTRMQRNMNVGNVVFIRPGG